MTVSTNLHSDNTSSFIHPTAIIENGAILGKNVYIGPYCCIGSAVVLGDNVRLISHITIAGQTTIGARTEIYPFASLGHRPQDLKYKGEGSQLDIGTDNQIREYVTVQPGTQGGGMITKVGNHCLLMASSHVAHDCLVGDHVILANNATLAGHVVVGDHAIIGGLSAIHQFVRIGSHAMIGGMSGVEADVIPYGVVVGERARLSGLNLIGLKRRGFSSQEINKLREAYKNIFSNIEKEGVETLLDRVKKVETADGKDPQIATLIDFIMADSHRNICLPK